MSLHTITRLEGYLAGMEGQPFADNPYQGRTLSFQQWKNGWFNGCEIKVLMQRVTEGQNCDCANCKCKSK